MYFSLEGAEIARSMTSCAMLEEIHSNGLNFTLSLRAYEGLSSMLLRPFLGRAFMF